MMFISDMLGFGRETICFKWWDEFCASYSVPIFLILSSLPNLFLLM